jgi:hypothetical protein
MAFRTAVTRRLNFDPKLGKMGGDRIGGEETRLFEDLRRQGLSGVWVPAARIGHYIPKANVSPRYAWDYWCGHGRTVVRMGRRPDPGTPTWWGAPRWWYRHYWQTLARAWVEWLTGRKSWVQPYLDAAFYAGLIQETRLLRVGVKTAPVANGVPAPAGDGTMAVEKGGSL